jgi:hypothetical protein
MPHKYFADQFDDEEVLYVFRKHPIVMRKGLIYSSVLMLVGPLYTLILTYVHRDDPPSMTFFFGSMVLSLVLAAILFMPYWIGWHFSVFIVTDQRLIQITQKGLFNRSVVDMSLNQIQMVNYDITGLEQTLLGFGTMTLQTFVGDLVIHEVHHPEKMQKKLLEILRKQGVKANTRSIKNADDVADDADADAVDQMSDEASEA